MVGDGCVQRRFRNQAWKPPRQGVVALAGSGAVEPPRKSLVSLTELSGTAKELPGSASASGDLTSSAESKLGMAASRRCFWGGAPLRKGRVQPPTVFDR